jgi:hypothetical protein
MKALLFKEWEEIMTDQPKSELDIMKIIDDGLQTIEDQNTRDRILNWALDKFGTPREQKKIIDQQDIDEKIGHPKKQKNKPRNSGKSRIAESIIKELNLFPKDKISFADFGKEKAPKNFLEQCTVSVYYLKEILELNNIAPNHVFTCFKSAGWKLPASVYDRLTKTASEKGWIDTSEMNDIKISSGGLNLVEHELPKKESK